MNWFRFKKNEEKVSSFVNETPTNYPNGTHVITDEGHWYLKGQIKYPLTTDRVVDSWNFPSAALATEQALSKYLKGAPLGFRPGTLLKNVSDGKMYLVEGVKRRHITNPDWLAKLGGEPVLVSNEEIILHQEGEPLN